MSAECSAYPNEGRCTHRRCLQRERNRLAAECERLAGALARWRDFDTWWQTDGRDQMPTEYAEPVDDALVAVKYPPPESAAGARP